MIKNFTQFIKNIGSIKKESSHTNTVGEVATVSKQNKPNTGSVYQHVFLSFRRGLESKINKLDVEVSNLKTQNGVSKLEAELKEIKQNLSQNKSEQSHLEVDLDLTRNKIIGLKEKLVEDKESLKSSAEEVLGGLKKIEATIDAVIVGIDKELDTTKAGISERTESISGLKEDLQNVVNIAKNLEGLVKEAQNELNAATADLTKAEGKVQSMSLWDRICDLCTRFIRFVVNIFSESDLQTRAEGFKASIVPLTEKVKSSQEALDSVTIKSGHAAVELDVKTKSTKGAIERIEQELVLLERQFASLAQDKEAASHVSEEVKTVRKDQQKQSSKIVKNVHDLLGNGVGKLTSVLPKSEGVSSYPMISNLQNAIRKTEQAINNVANRENDIHKITVDELHPIVGKLEALVLSQKEILSAQDKIEETLSGKSMQIESQNRNLQANIAKAKEAISLTENSEFPEHDPRSFKDLRQVIEINKAIKERLLSEDEVSDAVFAAYRMWLGDANIQDFVNSVASSHIDPNSQLVEAFADAASSLLVTVDIKTGEKSKPQRSKDEIIQMIDSHRAMSKGVQAINLEKVANNVEEKLLRKSSFGSNATEETTSTED